MHYVDATPMSTQRGKFGMVHVEEFNINEGIVFMQCVHACESASEGTQSFVFVLYEIYAICRTLPIKTYHLER